MERKIKSMRIWAGKFNTHTACCCFHAARWSFRWGRDALTGQLPAVMLVGEVLSCRIIRQWQIFSSLDLISFRIAKHEVKLSVLAAFITSDNGSSLGPSS